jgi:hypothetical protein
MRGGPSRTELTDRSVVVRRVVSLGLLCIALAAIASSDLLHEALLRIVDAGKTVIQISPALGMAGFVVLAAASAVLAFFCLEECAPTGSGGRSVDLWSCA